MRPELVGAALAWVITAASFCGLGGTGHAHANAESTPSAEPLEASPAIVVTWDWWTADEVAVARHCVNERTFDPVDDCIYIAGVEARAAERLGMSVRAFVARYYDNHTDPNRENRRWILGLDASLEKPAEWRDPHTWETYGRPMWVWTLWQAREGLRDLYRDCDGLLPLFWGGTCDSARIDRMTGPEGSYVRVACPNTANTFLTRRGWGRR